MDETTQTPPDAGASEQLAIEPTSEALAPVLSDDQRLERLLRNLLKGLVVAVVVFGVIYFFGQRQSHVEQAPPAQDQAVASAEASVRANPNDLQARISLAASYVVANRLDDAASQLREVLKAQPKNMPAMLGLGDVQSQQGDFTAARTTLAQYVALGKNGEFAIADEQLERAYFLLAEAELKLDDPKSAVQHLIQAVSINAGDADAWYALGNAQLKIEQYADATTSFRRALAFVPTGWCQPYEGLNSSYEGLSNADGVKFASAMVRICGGAGSDSAAPLLDLTHSDFAAEALFGLGTAAENDKDSTKALSYYQQELSIDRTNVAALTAINRLGATPDPQPIAGK